MWKTDGFCWIGAIICIWWDNGPYSSVHTLTPARTAQRRRNDLAWSVCSSAWTSGLQKLNSQVIIWSRASRFGSFLWNFLRFSFETSRAVDEVILDARERQRPVWLRTQKTVQIGSGSLRGHGSWPCAPLWSAVSSDGHLSSEWPCTLSQTFLPASHMGKLGAQKAKASFLLPQHGTVRSQVVMLWNASQNKMELPLPLLTFSI